MSLIDEMMDIGLEQSGRDPRVSGVTTGVVVENWDDKFPGLVKVEFFLGESGKTRTDWVRVAQPYAGNGYGNYWLPEVGDEVLLSFNLGDLNRPYVIGALWNNEDKLPEQSANDKNTVKMLRTKGGHQLFFEDKSGEESLIITTPKKLTIAFTDKDEVIVVKDDGGKNMLEIDTKNGVINLKADKKIKLDAGGKATLEMDGSGNAITIKAGNITIEAQQALKLKGAQFKAEGNTAEMKSSSTFKVEASAILELKGAMTKVN
jgi:uncharacterized protein involved in type VI secretion and phage assembly